MKSVYILTGEIGSGKTTFISQWMQGRQNVAGVITTSIEGKRVLLNIATGEERLFEVDDSFTGIVQKIGRYTFDESAFRWAEELINKTDFSFVKCFILDEAGILELDKKGFCTAINILLNKIRNSNVDLILVVRKTLVADMIKEFDLKNVIVYTKEDFKY